MKLALVKALRLFARRRPRASYGLARFLAWLTMPLGKGVREWQIGALFPGLTRAEVRAARRRTWLNFLLREALEGALAGPETRAVFPRSVPNGSLRELRPPAILVSFHIGPIFALEEPLAGLHGDVLGLYRNHWSSRSKTTFLQAGDDEWSRAQSFYRAVAALRSGGFVFIALDGLHAGTVEGPMLGRRISLARGPFALARLTGAPIVPVAARWNGTRVAVTVGSPILHATTDEATAAELAAWLERYLLEFPGEVGSVILGQLTEPAVDQQVAQVGVADLPVGGAGDRARRDDRDAAGREA